VGDGVGGKSGGGDSFVFPNVTGGYRAQLFVNGWQFGRRLGDLSELACSPLIHYLRVVCPSSRTFLSTLGRFNRADTYPLTSQANKSSSPSPPASSPTAQTPSPSPSSPSTPPRNPSVWAVPSRSRSISQSPPPSCSLAISRWRARRTIRYLGRRRARIGSRSPVGGVGEWGVGKYNKKICHEQTLME